jgi:hypothetical protein
MRQRIQAPIREFPIPGKVLYSLLPIPNHVERILYFRLLKGALKEEHIILIVLGNQK